MRGVILLMLTFVSVNTLVFISACRNTDTSPTPTHPGIALRFDEPVQSRFVQSTNTMVAEFPVTIIDTDGRGGQLEFVETIVFNRSRNLLVAINRRPNASYTFADRNLPSRGDLTVQAGVGFAPTPPRDEIVVTVRARLTDGREAERTAPLQQTFPDS